jgi:two-component system response regulator YesN
MIKILIADDEKLVLEGLEKIISNYSEKYTVCGLAEDGSEAIEIGKRENPHILITDIRMPHTDGIEVLKWFKKNQPSAHCIMISGHDDVEYLHAALRNNAVDYLLKPLKKKELFGILDSISERIEKENELIRKRVLAKDTYKNLFESFYNEIIYSDKYSGEQIKSFFEENKISLDVDEKLCLLYVKNNLENNRHIRNTNDVMLMNYGIKNIFDEMLTEKGINHISFFTKKKTIVFITEKSKADIKQTAVFIRNKINSVINQDVSVGISRYYNGIENSHYAFAEAQTVICNRFIYGTGVFEYSKEHDLKEDPRELFEYSKKLIRSIEEIDRERCRQIVDVLFNNLISSKKNVSFYILRVLEDFLYRIKILINEKHYITVTDEEIKKYTEFELESFENIDQIKAYIKSISFFVMEKTEQQLQSSLSKKICEAKKHIDQNYYQDISLNKMAMILNLSPNYLSEQFKKETGTTFVDYLTKVRIDAAIALFKENDLAIWEISAMVGYENPTYFSKVFKKVTGITPIQYKRKLFDTT